MEVMLLFLHRLNVRFFPKFVVGYARENHLDPFGDFRRKTCPKQLTNTTLAMQKQPELLGWGIIKGEIRTSTQGGSCKTRTLHGALTPQKAVDEAKRRVIRFCFQVGAKGRAF